MCEQRYDWFTVWRGPINQWAPCNFYCGFVWSFLFLHNNATVKGKQTHSGDAALKRLLHRQNQPDLRPHMRGGQSWWLYRTVWLLRKFSVVVFCWRWKTERVFFTGSVHGVVNVKNVVLLESQLRRTIVTVVFQHLNQAQEVTVFL